MTDGKPPSQRSRRHHRRGAALYVAVMFTALIVSLLGLSGLTLVRVERERAALCTDRLMAMRNARSAVELALVVISNDSDWRNTYTNGDETTPQLIGASEQGMVSWVLEDSDGSLTDADTELRLHGVGRVGGAVQVRSVEIEGTPTPLDSLQTSVYAVVGIDQSNTVTTTAGAFATAGTLNVGGTINGDGEGNPITYGVGGTITGTATDPGPGRTMPSPDVFDYYFDLATEIPYGSLPGGELQEVLLSAGSNPYGAPDADGVYYIHVPAGQVLGLTKVRVAATLVIEFEAGSSLDCQNTVLWEPSLGKNYPAMIAKTNGAVNIELAGASTQLKESTANTNFNPPGTPFDGLWDTDTSDRYDHRFRGLFHVIGASSTVELTRDADLNGCIVSEGTVLLENGIIVLLDTTLFTNPPEGYSLSADPMRAVMGTWRSEDAPTP